MSFQPDGAEGFVLMVLLLLTALGAIATSCAILSGVWHRELRGYGIFLIPFCFIPMLMVGSWLNYSIKWVPEVANVDELHYFDLQHIKTSSGQDAMVFYDNRGRFLYASRFGKPDDTLMARKRIFRGRSLLISWEWMEFDLVKK